MKKFRLILPFIILSAFAVAQDSTKILTHEVGFNTVSLIKQVISNNPTSALPQLPYDVFYNLYYKDKIGLRLGLGINTSNSQTDIVGQTLPRITNKSNLNFRAGVSYNIVKSRRIAINAFADYTTESLSLKTSNTTTAQTFPDPIENITISTTDKTTGFGMQFGFGVKYNITKHLSIYAEIPFTYISEKVTSTVIINDTGTIDQTVTESKNSSSQIILPTTVYLVLRF